MRSIVVCLFLLSEFQLAFGQKQSLDLAAIDKWPHIENERISNDGRYVLYNVSSKAEGTTLIIQALANPWKISIKNGTDAIFTEDNSRVIFKTTSDSLGMVELGASNFRLLDRIKSFVVPSAGIGQWLIYQLQDSANDVIVFDLVSELRKIYPHIKDFLLSDDGFRLLLQETIKSNSEERDFVTCLDLNLGSSYFIWQGKGDYNWKMDNSGSQVAFLRTSTVNNLMENKLWYFKVGMDSAILLIDDSTMGMEGATVGRNMPFFSPDGMNLFFSIHNSGDDAKSDSSNKKEHLIVWSYQDRFLDESPKTVGKDFEGVINLQFCHGVIRVERNDDDDSYSRIEGCYSNNNVICSINYYNGFSAEHYDAGFFAHRDLYLISTLDSTRTLLIRNCTLFPGLVGFSPNGNYCYWFDLSTRHWFCFNLKTRVTKNVSGRIQFSLVNNERGEAGPPRPDGIVGWMENDAGLLIYDKYDIWEVDPEGNTPPRNITIGYGRKHHSILRYLDLAENEIITFSPRDTLKLSILNVSTKRNGFAQIALNGQNDPIILAQGPIRYYGVYSNGLHADPFYPFGVKAKHASAYIFKPTRNSMYPNLCYSGDLVHFKQLTNYAPQKEWNWYTDELIHWKQHDGIANDGLLYKPENFDPKKKYPLIVFIYETFSDAVNAFLTPALCRGDVEILWYISHDYLVLVPDIHYMIGYPGKSAYNSVSSALQYLSRLPWIDMKHLGLQGHSYGGYEVNYILTRTKVFAAASSGDGVSDLTSAYGSTRGNSTGQSYFEFGQGRMGCTLWQRPDIYLNESPIMKADKVNTPVMLVHNPLDFTVPFSQGVEWFAALRRLGKKAWMVQYTNEGHNIEEDENKLDYSIKLSQFFDHFLKGTPVPRWMRGE